YGGAGFPHLSRIFPPISSSSSTSSSTDSDIQVSSKYRFHRKWCACVCIAVVFVGLGAAAGIYFGYQFLSLTPPMEQLYRGSFTVKSGDHFISSLAKPESSEFKERSAKYKGFIDTLYSQSLVKNAFLGSEILAFDGVVNGPLSVFFNIHVDTHRIRVDAGDLFIILADTFRSSKGVLNGSIIIDQDTLEIQERNIAFLYLPSTERNYVVIGGNDEADTSYEETNDRIESSTSRSSTISSSSSSSSSTTTTRRGAKHDINTGEKTRGEGRGNKNSHGSGVPTQRATSSSSPPSSSSYSPTSSLSPRTKTSHTNNNDYDNRNNDDLVDSSSENSAHTKVVTSNTVSSEPQDQCVPMNVDFCVNITGASKQNVMDELTMLQLASVVDSQCYPFAAHFICSWGIACKQDELIDHDGRPMQLCKDYCDEFMTNCGHKLSSSMKEKISCGGEWKGPNSCITKPGCVAELYNTGQKKRICDGVMDCIDFSDELHCPYCPPGNFHCGAGRECIPPEKKCDGFVDCKSRIGRTWCLTLAPSGEAAGYVHQYFNEGYLFVHDQGRLGKLCVERNESSSNSLWEPESQLLLDNIGSSACELLGFRKVAFVRIQPDTEAAPDSSEKGNEGNYVRIQEPGSSSEVTFSAGPCPSRKVLYVGCNHLECGQRPSHQRVSKGWAYHGDWPWHAALLKDGQHVCDATLVTSQWLITSDQCFTGQQKARWTVHFGRVRMSTTSPWQQERRVVGMVKSPLGDNLVLIKMASPVIFSDFARHICLPDEPDGRTGVSLPSWDKANAKCSRLGWSKGDELVETAMHQLSPDSCPGFPSSNQSDSRISPLCFENDPPGRDCLKEVKVFPGGPIFCQNDETKEWALAGIATVSSRPKCGIEKSKVSSLASSTEWILKTIEALSNTS
ncbi:Enteropeptidase, partial [Orchesella cincta]